MKGPGFSGAVDRAVLENKEKEEKRRENKRRVEKRRVKMKIEMMGEKLVS